MAATGMWTSVFVSVVFGWILLLAVTFAIPDTQSVVDDGQRAPADRAVHLGRSRWASSWAEFLLFICVVAQFFCVTASIDVGVSHDVRVLARPCRSGASALASRRARTACPRWSVLVVAFWRRHADDPGDLELLHRLRGGNRDRGDRPLHRVHHSRLPPLAEGRQLGRAERMEPRTALQVDRRRLDPLGRASSRSCSSSRCYTVGLPWNDPFDWQFTNYTILWFAGIGLVFGGWWALSAKNWFKGPVRMGTEEELERLEEEQLGEFALPTEASVAPILVSTRRAPRGALRRSGRARRRNAARLRGPTSRSKCSLAYASKSKSSSETADCTTPHIASRKSDMKRMSARACDVLVAHARRSRRRGASRSRRRRARG